MAGSSMEGSFIWNTENGYVIKGPNGELEYVSIHQVNSLQVLCPETHLWVMPLPEEWK